jgi:hypothetical protein
MNATYIWFDLRCIKAFKFTSNMNFLGVIAMGKSEGKKGDGTTTTYICAATGWGRVRLTPSCDSTGDVMVARVGRWPCVGVTRSLTSGPVHVL